MQTIAAHWPTMPGQRSHLGHFECFVAIVTREMSGHIRFDAEVLDEADEQRRGPLMTTFKEEADCFAAVSGLKPEFFHGLSREKHKQKPYELGCRNARKKGTKAVKANSAKEP